MRKSILVPALWDGRRRAQRRMEFAYETDMPLVCTHTPTLLMYLGFVLYSVLFHLRLLIENDQKQSTGFLLLYTKTVKLIHCARCRKREENPVSVIITHSNHQHYSIFVYSSAGILSRCIHTLTCVGVFILYCLMATHTWTLRVFIKAIQ